MHWLLLRTLQRLSDIILISHVILSYSISNIISTVELAHSMYTSGTDFLFGLPLYTSSSRILVALTSAALKTIGTGRGQVL